MNPVVDRRNYLGRIDPAQSCSQGASYRAAQTPVTLARPSGWRDSPLTAAFTLRLDTATVADVTGVVFEMGDATTMFGVSLFDLFGSTALEMVGGDTGGEADATFWDGVPVGHKSNIVVSVDPGRGFLRYWIDGVQGGRATDATTMSNGFAANDVLSVGSLSGAGSRFNEAGTLTGATIIGPVRFFFGQLPKQF